MEEAIDCKLVVERGFDSAVLPVRVVLSLVGGDTSPPLPRGPSRSAHLGALSLLPISYDDWVPEDAVLVGVRLTFGHGVITAESAADLLLLPGFAAGLRRLIGKAGEEDHDLQSRREFQRQERTGEVVLLDWDRGPLLVFCRAPDAQDVVMCGRFRQYAKRSEPPAAFDAELLEILGLRALVTSFQGLRMASEDAERIADLTMRFCQEHPHQESPLAYAEWFRHRREKHPGDPLPE